MAEELQQPSVMVKARDLKVVKEYVASLPEDQQAIFKERWNRIEDPNKRNEVIQKTIMAYGKRELDRSGDLGFGNQMQKMEQPIPERPNPFMAGANAVTSLKPADATIFGNPIKPLMAAGQVLAAPYQAVESAVANRALNAQKNPMTLLDPVQSAKDVIAGFTGPQKTMGDVNYRAGLNRPSADIAGLAQSVVLQSPESVQGAVDFVKDGGIQKAIKGLQSILTKPNGEKVLSDLQKKVQAGANLSDELSAMADEARKTAGATQGGYIDANASELVDAKKLGQIINRLPKPLQKEIQRLKINLKSNPTLGGAEKIRAIIKGRVPSSNWNIKSVDETMANAASQGYDDIGNLMKEGRPELAEAMGRYADTKNAQKQIVGRLETNTGMTKSNPVLEMFGKNVDNADVQAISKLAEENPEILQTIAKIKKLEGKIARQEAIGNFAKKYGAIAATSVATALGFNFLNNKK
jgi:hypothetical protein